MTENTIKDIQILVCSNTFRYKDTLPDDNNNTAPSEKPQLYTCAWQSSGIYATAIGARSSKTKQNTVGRNTNIDDTKGPSQEFTPSIDSSRCTQGNGPTLRRFKRFPEDASKQTRNAPVYFQRVHLCHGRLGCKKTRRQKGSFLFKASCGSFHPQQFAFY